MKFLPHLLAASLCFLAVPATAQNVSDSSDLGGFRLHRAAGMKALNEARFYDATRELAQAQALINDSPSILLLSAQNALGLRDFDGAKIFVHDYLKRGFVLDLRRNPEFSKLMDADLSQLQEENQSQLGTMNTVISLSDFVLLDSIAYDPVGDTTYLGALKTGDILKNDGTGARVLSNMGAGLSPQGLALHEGLLWVSVAPSRQNEGYTQVQGSSFVAAIDPSTGEVTKTVAAPDSDRSLGRLFAGQDALYVADLNHAEILRLDHYTGTLQVLIPEGFFDAPQAMLENAEGSKLLISDFTSGLYVVDFAAGTLTRLVPPDNGSLLGITSLSLYGQDLLAVQNGFDPPKVMRLSLSEDWSKVLGAKVLLRSSSSLKQPGQGVMVGDHFRFIAQSQWESLSKTAPKGQYGPAIVADVKIQ